MTVSEALASVEFIVGRDGKPRAAVLDIAAWEALIAWLEDAEDLGLAMDYLARRRRWGWCRGRKWRGDHPFNPLQKSVDSVPLQPVLATPNSNMLCAWKRGKSSRFSSLPRC